MHHLRARTVLTRPREREEKKPRVPKNIDGGNKKQVLDRWHEVRNCRPLQLAGKLSQKRRGEYGGFWRGVSRSGEYPVVRCTKQQTVEHATVLHFLEEVEVVVAMTELALIDCNATKVLFKSPESPRHVCSARGGVSENNELTTTTTLHNISAKWRSGLDGASYVWCLGRFPPYTRADYGQEAVGHHEHRTDETHNKIISTLSSFLFSFFPSCFFPFPLLFSFFSFFFPLLQEPRTPSMPPHDPPSPLHRVTPPALPEKSLQALRWNPSRLRGTFSATLPTFFFFSEEQNHSGNNVFQHLFCVFGRPGFLFRMCWSCGVFVFVFVGLSGCMFCSYVCRDCVCFSAVFLSFVFLSVVCIPLPLFFRH